MIQKWGETTVTSEVLILNKRAIVLGADSAVTTSGGEHPRYSKSANKIFELSNNGSVAAAIYGSAALDSVPWELAIKLFRTQLDRAKFDSLTEYGAALFAYLNGNNKLFPSDKREELVPAQFDSAVKVVLQEAQFVDDSIFEKSLSKDERATIWAKAAAKIDELLTSQGVAAPLTREPLDKLLTDLAPWIDRVTAQISLVAEFQGVEAKQLAELAHRLRYSFPTLVLSSTGVVIAGFGEEQIYPAYEQFEVYGHVGDQLFFQRMTKFEIEQDGIAMIKSLAQTSMIDMFTDGFSSSLEKIMREQGLVTIRQVFDEVEAAGVNVEPQMIEKISDTCHRKFMENWKTENWKQNFHPLLSVIQSLSIPEMAHLAESLLSLQSLKERVTSPSESVGGPIDVAAITKTEGLVWIKRKHYFEADLNLRYAARLGRSLGS